MICPTSRRVARGLALALLLGACASAPAPEERTAADAARASFPPAEPFPPAKTGLVIPPSVDGRGWSVVDLCRRFGEVTGMTVAVHWETARELERAPVAGQEEIVVSREQVYTVVEGLLRQNGQVLYRVHAGEPWIVGVLALPPSRRPSMRALSLPVKREELEAWSDHACSLVTTVVNLPNTDVRAAAESLRPAREDAVMRQVFPVESSRLLIVGFAPEVLALVRALEEVDARGGEPEAVTEAGR